MTFHPLHLNTALVEAVNKVLENEPNVATSEDDELDLEAFVDSMIEALEEIEEEVDIDALLESVEETLFSIDEDVADLQELSRKTLGSYAKKAIRDKEGYKRAADSAYAQADQHAASARGARDLPARSHYTKLRYQWTDQGNRYVRKVVNRNTGTNRAIDKMAREDVDPIVELSVTTLANYVNKAQNKMPEYAAKARKYSKKSKETEWMRKPGQEGNFAKWARHYKNKVANRKQGIKTASGKMVKKIADYGAEYGGP